MKDTIKLPLDADGVPIRPGDVVYKLNDSKPLKVMNLQYTSFEGGSWFVTTDDFEDVIYGGDCYTHEKYDSFGDIEREIRFLINMGSTTRRKEAQGRVAPLMERIKRMVER